MNINQINIPLPNLVSEVLTDGDFGAEDISTSGTMTLSDLSTEGVVINSAAGVLSSYNVDLDDLVLKADYAFGANNFTGSGGFSGGAILGTSLEAEGVFEATSTAIGCFGGTPVTQQTALTASVTDTVDSTYGSEESTVINNLRTRLDELETKLQAYGLLA